MRPPINDPFARARRAHREAVDARAAMQVAAMLRGAAVRDALAEGYSWREIAEALGVTTQRVIAMSKHPERLTS